MNIFDRREKRAREWEILAKRGKPFQGISPEQMAETARKIREDIAANPYPQRAGGQHPEERGG